VETLNIESYKAEIHRILISKLDLEKLSRVNSDRARQAVLELIKEIMGAQRAPLNLDEQEKIMPISWTKYLALARWSRCCGIRRSPTSW
jgi:hypothetical protein